MALAPRSSLRPLVPLTPAAVPPPGNCTPAAPVVQPPAALALPDCLSHKYPHEELVLHPLPDPPKKGNAVIGKGSASTLENPEQPVLLLCTVDEDPEHPAPDYCSYGSRPEPVSYCDNPGPRYYDGVGHPIPDPPIRTGNALLDEPSPSTPEHRDRLILSLGTVDKDPEDPTPDFGGGSYSSTDKPRRKPPQNENITHPLPDPPGRW